jgi:hypothetical protein
VRKGTRKEGNSPVIFTFRFFSFKSNLKGKKGNTKSDEKSMPSSVFHLKIGRKKGKFNPERLIGFLPLVPGLLV